MFALESANIVGYADKALTQGYGVTSISFMKVGAEGDGSFEIADLTPKSASAWNIDSCVFLNLIDETGYNYYTYTWCDWRADEEDTESFVGWVDNDFAEVTAGDENHTYAAGSAFWVQIDTHSDIKVTVSGQVKTTDTPLAPNKGYGVIGNPYPCDVLISKITPSCASAWNFDSCVFLNLIDETGYNYYTYTWCDWRANEEDTESFVGWVDNEFAEVDDDDVIAANGALWFQIDTYDDIKLLIPAPAL